MNTQHKKATNVTISQDLLKKSKEYKINLSQTLEHSLQKIITEKEKERWREENKDAIDEYNQTIDKEGVFGDEFRSF